MARFLIRRVLLGAFVMWLVTMVVFAIFFVNPSGPKAVAQRLAGRQATPQSLALVRRRLGLDDSIPVQYWHFLNRLLHGNLGYDFYNQVSVNHIIAQAFPITLSLALGASVLWLAMGLFSGI
ncbi:MAG: peptide/nickel transport system permease protein, partial [Frankiaceae bacterium]|nr:peptide/nickel transport system permease protein [Frankiaceae bacterium]